MHMTGTQAGVKGELSHGQIHFFLFLFISFFVKAGGEGEGEREREY